MFDAVADYMNWTATAGSMNRIERDMLVGSLCQKIQMTCDNNVTNKTHIDIYRSELDSGIRLAKGVSSSESRAEWHKAEDEIEIIEDRQITGLIYFAYFEELDRLILAREIKKPGLFD